jgi:hypothetical protein
MRPSFDLRIAIVCNLPGTSLEGLGITPVDVTDDTLASVMSKDRRWVVMVVRLPTEPSRHRVAVWRELRRIGALSLGQGIWTAPDVPAFADGIQRAVELAERGDGDVVLLDATGRSDSDTDRLTSLFNDARRAEWDEFVADCAKFEAEIDKELAANKLTLAELEEEEQSVDRLRRWYRELKTRDVFSSEHAAAAEQRLKDCIERLEDYTQRVFAAVHQM